ncbi:MAG: M1 family metallopeptidase, partial [Saprospiraceae bacterium]|nr:M1 family metallopeptidase [Saprospiraceae bacterium]
DVSSRSNIQSLHFQRLMHRFLFILGLGLVTLPAAAQTTLFFPRNLQKAYTAGTRSWDGKPGPKYWQNRANYVIKASLEPKTRRLSGEETITYFNNSPDTLKQIRFKLQHDRYKKGGLRYNDVTPSDVDDGVNIEALTYNGLPVEAKDRPAANTFMNVQLTNKPLSPRATATLTVRWSYTLPAGEDASRECVCDSTTFFIPYWYPQIAVYDDLNGWASAPYSGLQEFYHEFGNYDVTFTWPAGYQMWATGEWQNAEAILLPAVLKRWETAHTSAEVLSIFSENDLKKGQVFRKKTPNAFRFMANDVPDFALAGSNHFHWDATSVVVDDRTGRRTFVSAVYNTASTDYKEVARIAADGIRLMSTWLPGYPFPYPAETIFNGNDGMEYPMMCNNTSTAPNSPMTLTIHEVSHTYFPFMMGINEQDYAWMDEGWAAFFDYMLSDSLSKHTQGRVRDYSSIAGSENDVPPMVRSRNLTTAYRNASYQRPQQVYFTLLDLLGYEKFHRTMTEYMDRWKGKHPAPFDFFLTWNNASGENLDWFWKPWFFEWGYPDLAIQGIKQNETTNRPDVVVERLGQLPVPVIIMVEYEDGTKETLHETAAVWKDGQKQVRVPGAAGKKIKTARLGAKTVPDVDQKNNVWPIGQ